jgi:hypothetical protein
MLFGYFTLSDNHYDRNRRPGPDPKVVMILTRSSLLLRSVQRAHSLRGVKWQRSITFVASVAFVAVPD